MMQIITVLDRFSLQPGKLFLEEWSPCFFLHLTDREFTDHEFTDCEFIENCVWFLSQVLQKKWRQWMCMCSLGDSGCVWVVLVLTRITQHLSCTVQ